MGRAAYEPHTGATAAPVPVAAHPPVSVDRAGQDSRRELFTVIAAYGLPSPTRAGRSPPVVVESQI